MDKSTYQLLGSSLGFLLLFFLFAIVGSGLFKTPDWLKTLEVMSWVETREQSASNTQLPNEGSAIEQADANHVSGPQVGTSDTTISYSGRADSSMVMKSGNGGRSDSSGALINEPPPVVLFEGDPSSKERILLVGDSQCGGLRYPLYSYSHLNGHQLVASVTWYSSTTKHWAVTDTLQHFMAKFQPTLVIVGLGLNEVFARDIEKRKKYIEIINQKIDSAGAKVFWMGPAAWVQDKGIVSAIRDVNGIRFFDATSLSLTRGGDGRHPDMRAYKFWFSHAAAYMTQSGLVDFSKTEPYKNPGRDTKSISLSTHRL